MLVSIAVVSLLIGLMLPTLSGVREATRRIVCSSNLRQVGLGLHMYADDWRGALPPSIYLLGQNNGEGPAIDEMMAVRTDLLVTDPRWRGGWDGIGFLYVQNYLPAPELYYCPSHTGDHPFDRYAPRWHGEAGEIVANYHYRGEGPEGQRSLFDIEPYAALVADGMRTIEDYNHKVGSNVLRAGLSVGWFSDPGGEVATLLADDGSGDPGDIRRAWNRLDRPADSDG